MSYTEPHTGKLKPIRYHISVEEFKTWLLEDEGRYTEDFDEKLEGGAIILVHQGDWRGDYTHVFSRNTLYEFLDYKEVKEVGYLDITKKSEDGMIDFTYLFYNGGTGFDEMLEEGLNSL